MSNDCNKYRLYTSRVLPCRPLVFTSAGGCGLPTQRHRKYRSRPDAAALVTFCTISPFLSNTCCGASAPTAHAECSEGSVLYFASLQPADSRSTQLQRDQATPERRHEEAMVAAASLLMDHRLSHCRPCQMTVSALSLDTLGSLRFPRAPCLSATARVRPPGARALAGPRPLAPRRASR